MTVGINKDTIQNNETVRPWRAVMDNELKEIQKLLNKHQTTLILHDHRLTEQGKVLDSVISNLEYVTAAIRRQEEKSKSIIFLFDILKYAIGTTITVLPILKMLGVI